MTTRVRTADALNLVNNMVRSEASGNAGANTLISRAEQQGLSPELQQAAKSVRAAGGAGTRVTVDAVVDNFMSEAQAAMAAVNTRGPTLVSRDEIAALQQQAPAVGNRVAAAATLLRGAAPTPPAVTLPPGPLSGAEIESFIAPLTPNLYWDGLLGSEGGEDITAVRGTGTYARLDKDAFRAAFGLSATSDNDFLERFERPSARLLKDFVDSIQDADKPKAQAIVDLMKRDLRDLRVVVLGKDGAPGVNVVHPTYVVGLAADGSVAGFQTAVVWT